MRQEDSPERLRQRFGEPFLRCSGADEQSAQCPWGAQPFQSSADIRLKLKPEHGRVPECRAAIIALTSYVAYLERDKVSYDALRASWAHPVPTSFTKKANQKSPMDVTHVTGPSKRKAECHGPAQKRARIEEAVKKRNFTRQYYLGRSILDDSLKGLGCGHYLLGTPMLPFKSPIDSEMRIEIMDGMGDPGKGGLRISTPEKSIVDPEAYTFLVPFVHMGEDRHNVVSIPADRATEEILILPPAKKTKAEVHRVVIVPRGSADASALGRELPKMVDFSLPDKKPGNDELGGRHGHETSSKDTYLSLFDEVCNERLKGCSKSVVQFDEKDDLTLSRAMLHSDEADINAKGEVFFLSTGLFFSSKDQRHYLSHASLKSVRFVIDKDTKSGKSFQYGTNMSIWLEVYRDNRDEQTLLLAISGLNPTRPVAERLEQYFDNHNIEHQRFQQKWYDFKKRQPMTGFEALEYF